MCANPDTDRMTFVESHQRRSPATASARARTGSRFRSRLLHGRWQDVCGECVDGATDPLTAASRVGFPRLHAARALGQDANDSYFVAMTYPEGLPLTQQPTDIHDATWGVVSAVYGGAVHPTAEGHAAMADAALAAARGVLGLGNGAPSVSSEPLAPPAQ